MSISRYIFFSKSPKLPILPPCSNAISHSAQLGLTKSALQNCTNSKRSNWNLHATGYNTPQNKLGQDLTRTISRPTPESRSSMHNEPFLKARTSSVKPGSTVRRPKSPIMNARTIPMNNRNMNSQHVDASSAPRVSFTSRERGRDSEKEREQENFYSTLMPEILPGCLFPFSSRFHSHVFSVYTASGVRLPVCLYSAFVSVYIRKEIQFVHTHI